MIRHRKIRRELKRLSLMQPDDIAKEFQQLKVYGATGNSKYCPLARQLQLVDGFHHDVAVSHGTAFVNLRRYALPATVSAFVRAFDCGTYPEIEVPRWTAPFRFYGDE